MFNVGDFVNCVHNLPFSVPLDKKKTYQVTKETILSSGFQYVWLVGEGSNAIRTDRLRLVYREMPYDPTQQGDTEDDI